MCTHLLAIAQPVQRHAVRIAPMSPVQIDCSRVVLPLAQREPRSLDNMHVGLGVGRTAYLRVDPEAGKPELQRAGPPLLVP